MSMGGGAFNASTFIDARRGWVMGVDEQVREEVRARYAAAARQAGCCGSGCGAAAQGAVFGADLYDVPDIDGLPQAAVLASLGCGNPTAVAELRAGDRVLDLGSGGGIDVLLSARRVGPTGFAYGVDMTEEMLELARANAFRAGATNVEFRQGTIEDLPWPDASVDVVIPNSVTNLPPDKPAVPAQRFALPLPDGPVGPPPLAH